MSTLGGICSPVCTMCGHFDETYHICSPPGPYDADDISEVVGSKVKVTDNIFRKFFSGGGISFDGFTSRTV